MSSVSVPNILKSLKMNLSDIGGLIKTIHQKLQVNICVDMKSDHGVQPYRCWWSFVWFVANMWPSACCGDNNSPWELLTAAWIFFLNVNNAQETPNNNFLCSTHISEKCSLYIMPWVMHSNISPKQLTLWKLKKWPLKPEFICCIPWCWMVIWMIRVVI